MANFENTGFEDNGELRDAIMHIRNTRPKIKAEQLFTIYTYPETSTIQLWIRTVGCSFSQKGNCSMCDYWIGDRLGNPDIIIRDVLFPYKGKYETLIFNTCGSPLDEFELSLTEQEKIWKCINSMGFSVVIIETHALTVTKEKLKLIKRNISAVIVIEMGLESSNPTTLRYCLNKSVSLQIIKDKIDLVHSFEMHSCINILLGVPFLSIEDRITDCINSIRDVIACGTDTCVVFPVNIKDYTLVKLLYEYNLYRRVWVNELVEVLSHFSGSELCKINIAWLKPSKQENLSYTGEIIPPYLPEAYAEKLYECVDHYLSTYDIGERTSCLQQIDSLLQSCDKEYQKQKSSDYKSKDLISKGYILIRSLTNEKNIY